MNDILGTFRIIFKIGFQEIREKKQPQDCEHDKQFDTDDDPQSFSDGHTAKTVDVELQYFVWKIQGSLNFIFGKNTNFYWIQNGKNIFF